MNDLQEQIRESGDKNRVDVLCTGIERAIPPGTTNEDAKKALEYCAQARKFGNTDKGWNFVVEAESARKDFVYFDVYIKGLSKVKQEDILNKVRTYGTAANKKKADNKRTAFDKAVNDYIDNYPNALALGVKGLEAFIKSRGLNFGYEDSTISQYAKPLFSAKRKAIKKNKS